MMKRYLFTLLLCSISSVYHFSFSQTSKPTFVIVHGTWGGGWAFKEVDSLLTDTGSIVYRPTLTGLGERVHLASKNIGLYTHINDVVNTVLYENLHNIILVGHSYGGMVVTGVADSIPDRIKKLIYVDAMVPENGESLLTIAGIDTNSLNVSNGFLVPQWVSAGQKPPKDVPHPVKTWADTISLKNENRLLIPTTYILTVAKGSKPENDDFAFQALRAQEKDWPVLHLEADHNPQWSNPNGFVKMLMEEANTFKWSAYEPFAGTLEK